MSGRMHFEGTSRHADDSMRKTEFMCPRIHLPDAHRGRTSDVQGQMTETCFVFEALTHRYSVSALQPASIAFFLLPQIV